MRTPLGSTVRRTSEAPEAVNESSARSSGRETAPFFTRRAYVTSHPRNTDPPKWGNRNADKQTGLSVPMCYVFPRGTRSLYCRTATRAAKHHPKRWHPPKRHPHEGVAL